MAYKVPQRVKGRPFSGLSSSRFPIVIPKDLRKRMAKLQHVNWAQVCRDALERVCTIEEGGK